MPSAEKSTHEALKIEGAPVNEPKPGENAQKDSEHNNAAISPIQQALQIIQNKVRNLEKRKNKLDGYMKEEEAGKELSNEQAKAVSKYEEVSSQLLISKEFCKQFQTIATAASKDQKREARKATFLRQIQETAKVREVITIQDLLRQLKNDSIRNDFLNGENGACLVDAAEMNVLEQFSKYTIPVHPTFSNEPSFSTSAKTAADHLSFVVDARTRQFMETGYTYEKIKELFHRIQSCGYFEKDIKVVEVVEEERPIESETPQTDEEESKEEKPESEVAILPPSAPLPAQVPNPTPLFNGNMMPVMHAPMQVISQQQVALKTTVTAVENAFFNQMKYSQPQGPMMNNVQPNRYVEDFASANISFLQDSLVEQMQSGSGSQQQQQPQQQQQSQQQQPNQQSQIPPNIVNQPKHSPIQQAQSPQTLSTQTFTNQNYQQPPPQQQQPQQTQNYPPGLKLQGNASNIPVNYSQQQPSQQTQQHQVNASVSIPHSQSQQQQQQQQQHLITKQPPQASQNYQSIVTNSVQYQQQTQQQQLPTNIPNLQDVEQKTLQQQNVDTISDKSTSETPDRKIHTADKENNSRNNEWNPGNNQQPHIDTWTNDTPTGGSSQTGTNNYSRFNRNRGSGGSKYNNYRNSQQPRNNYNNENGNGESGRDGGGTFFRNNERYNSGGPGRYNNVSDRGNYKRENYRGSGRFSSSMSQGNSNPGQRK